MPKASRTTEEVEAVRERILAQALDLINTHGFEGFSMRKLADRLGVTPKTIYNYFKNKDELYLVVVGRGYRKLYEQSLAVLNTENTPMERLVAVCRAYMEFGIANPNYYNLMFTWHVPKFSVYLGTPLEKTAIKELGISIKLYELILSTMQDIAPNAKNLNKEDIQSYCIYFWCLMHGYIAAYNNTMLHYMHEDPLSLRQTFLDRMIKNMQAEAGEAIKKYSGAPLAVRNQ